MIGVIEPGVEFSDPNFFSALVIRLDLDESISAYFEALEADFMA